MTTDPEQALLRLLEGLDRLEIAYMVAGSTASSIYGVWRATNDVDVVVQLPEEQLDDFVAEFQHEFYLAPEQIRQAILFRRAFNLIHLGSAYKFDLFPLAPEAFPRQQFARRRYESAAVFGAARIELAVASPEDVVLSKLAWYRQGGEVSTQQWNDILGVLAAQRGRIDVAYLREWAGKQNLADLLEAALSERHGDA